MKIAVLADIHGNLEALAAVCSDLEPRGIDRVVSLGDNVGYGPDPEGVTRLVREKGFVSVLGNHEFALNDKRARRWLNFQAEENNIATKELLSRESLAYYQNLPMSVNLEQGHFVHGYPPSSVFRYLNRQSDAKVSVMFDALPSQVFFVGHTHRLQLVVRENGRIVRRPLHEETVYLDPRYKYVISAGSVGQPRDGDPRAKYLIWDSVSGKLEVMYVAYDFTRTKQKIKSRGFPEIYAMRLGSKASG